MLLAILFGFLVLPSAITALPYYNIDRQQLNYVDINQFSQLFSSHLLFDHLDGTLTVLSKCISLHFQSLIQVNAQSLTAGGGPNDDFEVDIDLLKGQLQGAVGSFIEDSLPAVWNTRSNVINQSSLCQYIEKTTSEYCTIRADNILMATCIQTNAKAIASRVDLHIENHVKHMLPLVVMDDLPRLFQTMQSHVNGILAHFNHYLVNDRSFKEAIVIQQQNPENSVELMISYLEMALHVHHDASLKDTWHSSLEKFISLAQVN